MPTTTKSKPRMPKGAKMKMPPIRSEAEEDAALETIDGLTGAAPGRPEGDALAALAVLVEAYEAAHWPVDAAVSGL